MKIKHYNEIKNQTFLDQFETTMLSVENLKFNKVSNDQIEGIKENIEALLETITKLLQ